MQLVAYRPINVMSLCFAVVFHRNITWVVRDRTVHEWQLLNTWVVAAVIANMMGCMRGLVMLTLVVCVCYSSMTMARNDRKADRSRTRNRSTAQATHLRPGFDQRRSVWFSYFIVSITIIITFLYGAVRL